MSSRPWCSCRPPYRRGSREEDAARPGTGSAGRAVGRCDVAVPAARERDISADTTGRHDSCSDGSGRCPRVGTTLGERANIPVGRTVRHGAMSRLTTGVRAPSTLGTCRVTFTTVMSASSTPSPLVLIALARRCRCCPTPTSCPTSTSTSHRYRRRAAPDLPLRQARRRPGLHRCQGAARAAQDRLLDLDKGDCWGRVLASFRARYSSLEAGGTLASRYFGRFGCQAVVRTVVRLNPRGFDVIRHDRASVNPALGSVGQVPMTGMVGTSTHRLTGARVSSDDHSVRESGVVVRG